MAVRDEAGVLEIVEGAKTDQWRPTLCGRGFWGESACARGPLAVRPATGAVTQTRSAYGVFITEG